MLPIMKCCDNVNVGIYSNTMVGTMTYFDDLLNKANCCFVGGKQRMVKSYYTIHKIIIRTYMYNFVRKSFGLRFTL